MSAKKFNTPFAILGDKVEVPTTAQIDGSVSFEQGYPFGYELDYTDPNTKDISRSKTNQLLFDITNAIREIQQGGVSEWSEEGNPYKINSLVYAPDGTVKQSLIANNNNDTTHSSWSNLINASTLATLDTQNVKLTGNQTIAGVKTFSSSPIVPTPTTGTHAVNKQYVDDNSFNPTPTITGTVSFNSTTNNINLTNIVTSLGLEIGDVIQISGATDSKNNSEFTVEVITNNSNIIVNQAHANKGTSKNVANRSGDTGVTVKLLSKCYNAPIGLGQDWVDVSSSRVSNTNYPNNLNRNIQLVITFYDSGVAKNLYINNSLIKYYTNEAFRQTVCYSPIIPKNATYKFDGWVTGTGSWWELR